MPSYDYQCDKCGHHFEAILPSDNRDDPVGCACDECEEGIYKRIIGAPRISWDTKGVLKRAGDGFKEVQQKIMEGPGITKNHTIRTK